MTKRPKKATKVQFALRMPESLRDRIEQSATRHGASLNGEIVRRLDDSFVNKDDLFFGEDNRKLMQFLAAGLHQIERRTGKTWREDPTTREAAKAALITLFNLLAPRTATDAQSTAGTDIGVRLIEDMLVDIHRLLKQRGTEK